MFAGNSNTEMLRLIMEVKGRINSKMLRKGEYTLKHFDAQNRLLIRDVDPVTKEVRHFKKIYIGISKTNNDTNKSSKIDTEHSNEKKVKRR